MGETRVTACDVHVTLDGDYSDRKCTYCGFCNAWVCEADLHSARRIQAFAAQKGISLSGLKKYLGL